ncbi:MAG: TonB-dependent receptor [Pseudomonadota bacterium]
MSATPYSRLALWALGGAVSCAGPACAALTEADFLDELPVVLSVSRLSQPVNEAPAAVTVIDQDMIRASGFRDIPDLLRLVPGFSVAYTRDNTWAIGYHGMADAFSRRFQVLVDGRSIYSAAYGAVQWQELPLAIDDIERIEVVRGPNAATHGANAFLAVINIITKDPSQTPGSFASMQLGEQGMAGVTLRHGGHSGDWRYRLTLSVQDRDRFETDARVDATGLKIFEQTRTSLLNGRADYRVSSTDELSVQIGLALGDWQAGRLDVADPLKAEYLLEPRQQEVTNAFVQLRYRRVHSPEEEWSWQFYHSRHDFEAAARASLLGLTIVGDQNALQTRTSLEFNANTRLAPTLRAAWGAEVRKETARSPLYFGDSGTHDGVLARANANLEWRAQPDLLLQGGAMLEHHYYLGLRLSPRIAANYEFAPGHALRASVSQAYRTPTFLEQDGFYVYRSTAGDAIDVIGISPNELAPERIRSQEIAYVGHYKPWALQLDARLFRDRVSDYIGTVTTCLPPGTELISAFVLMRSPCDTPGLGRAREVVNGGQIDVRGGELQLNWQPVPVFRLTVNYARVFISGDDALNVIDNDVDASAPRTVVGLLGRYQLPHGWTLSGGVYRSGRMTWLADGDPVPRLTRVDARLARRWTWQGHELEAAVVGQSLAGDYSEFRRENVFDQRVYGSFSVTW